MKRMIKDYTDKERYTIIYYWYDHLVLRRTGEASIVQHAIENHDFDTFKKIVDKYPPYEASDGVEEIYFPEVASVYDNETEDFVDYINIMSPKNFQLIDASDFECG